MKEYIIKVNESDLTPSEKMCIRDYHPTDLVRCKDCRHGYICENNVRCENRNNPAMIGQHNGFDWFCADGERK